MAVSDERESEEWYKKPPLSVTERYFKKYYYVDINNSATNCEDQCVLQHSNGVFVVCLSARHTLLSNQTYKIKSVDYQCGHVDRTANKVSGKKKKGGQQLHSRSIICVLSCEDGAKFNIRSCIRGNLLEVNGLLVNRKELIVSKTLSEGYFAIILPRLQDVEKIVADLMPEQDYERS